MTKLTDKMLSLTPGQRVELYTVDLQPVGGGTLRFTPNREDLTPGSVARLDDNLSDSSAGTRTGIYTRATNQLQAGDRLVGEVYVRQPSGDGFPSLQLTSNGGEDTGTATRFAWHPGTGAVHASNANGGVGTDLTMNLTQTSEWQLVTFAVILQNAGGLSIHIEPTTGGKSSFPIVSNSREFVGKLDVFGLRMWAQRGGSLVPVLTPVDLTSWQTKGTSFAAPTDVPNVHECIKVPIWQGNTYTPLPIKASGYERNGVGPMPTPTLQMSNVTGAGSLFMQQYGDVRGLEVIRTRLYADNLDNGVDPDPASFYAPEVYYIDRRTQQNSDVLEIALASKLDQQGVKLPRRQVLRDICPWKYRAFDPAAANGQGAFNYPGDDDGCPYTDDDYYDVDGNAVTDPRDDKCSQRLDTGCRVRFGTHRALPLGNFPMVGRQRQ